MDLNENYIQRAPLVIETLRLPPNRQCEICPFNTICSQPQCKLDSVAADLIKTLLHEREAMIKDIVHDCITCRKTDSSCYGSMKFNDDRCGCFGWEWRGVEKQSAGGNANGY